MLVSECEEGGSRVGLPEVPRRLASWRKEDRSECAALQEREALDLGLVDRISRDSSWRY